jgi:activator of HSP90 ATPase
VIEVVSIRQKVHVPLEPHEVYETLLDPDRHSALTGLPCKIERTVGGKFEVGENMIEGTLLEFVPDRRIIERWRISSYGWPPQHFSKLQLELEPADGGTLVSLEQSDVPQGCGQLIEVGWYQYYWNPLGAAQQPRQ